MDDFPDPDADDSICEGIFKSLQSFFGGEDHRFSPRTGWGKIIVYFLSSR